MVLCTAVNVTPKRARSDDLFHSFYYMSKTCTKIIKITLKDVLREKSHKTRQLNTLIRYIHKLFTKKPLYQISTKYGKLPHLEMHFTNIYRIYPLPSL